MYLLMVNKKTWTAEKGQLYHTNVRGEQRSQTDRMPPPADRSYEWWIRVAYTDQPTRRVATADRCQI